MNIGSKVRLLHGKEEGVITKISGNFIEIDLGDGFEIPVLASEVVLISPMETRLGSVPEKVTAPKSSSRTFSKKGIYMAFAPINDREIVLHLINLTGWRILFTIFGRTGGHSKGLASGVLDPDESHQVTKLLLKEFEKWPVFETHLLYYSDQHMPEQASLGYSLRCRAQSFHKHLQTAPLLNVKAHVFQVDSKEGQSEEKILSAATIRESMFETTGQSNPIKPIANRVPSQIDLHTNALPEITPHMSKEDILEVQLSAFKAYLERSIAGGLENITIIHGVGQGTLRQEIHRQLSNHPNVASFQDARKEKFGYGATIARLQ